MGLAVAASLALSLIDGPLLERLDLPVLESWGILALQLVAVASFVSLMTVVAGAGADRPQRLSDPTGDELVTASLTREPA